MDIIANLSKSISPGVPAIAVLPGQLITLGAWFSHGLTEAADEHVVVVLVIGTKRFGLLVDDVSDIISLDETELKPMPEVTGFGQTFPTDMVVQGDRILIRLDAHRVVGAAGFQ